ncbi:hypothetical protein QYM36_000065 [Artemia franciscana]|uniref:G-protein coupled receptors family 1 profile domain-containing protein n=2 Tax=Artemia franciscana TaxID=6661 RepID=A0AA88IRI2_ARTSF|nr:hypothetical protein QYM36_000065 [Artemia franciscana]
MPIYHSPVETYGQFENISLDDLCSLQQNYTLLESEDDYGLIILLPAGERVVPTWFKCLLGSLYILCILWAVPGNLQTIYRAISNSKKWTSTNILVATLAVTDLLTLCSTVPTEMTYFLTRYQAWAFDSAACPGLTFLQNSAILLNAAVLCLIAWDRYRGVVNALTTGSTRNPRLMLILIAASAVVCFVVSAPTIFYWETYEFLVATEKPPYIDFCGVYRWCAANQRIRQTDPNSLPAYYTSLFVFIFVPLMSVYIVFYVEIIRFLWLRKPVGNNAVGRQRKKRIATALFILIAAFCICRMPIWIFILITMVTTVPNSIENIILKCCLAFLSVVNTGLNPHLYMVIGDPLKNKRRKKCMSAFCKIVCFCCSENAVGEGSTSISTSGDNSGAKAGDGNPGMDSNIQKETVVQTLSASASSEKDAAEPAAE